MATCAHCGGVIGHDGRAMARGGEVEEGGDGYGWEGSPADDDGPPRLYGNREREEVQNEEPPETSQTESTEQMRSAAFAAAILRRPRSMAGEAPNISEAKQTVTPKVDDEARQEGDGYENGDDAEYRLRKKQALKYGWPGYITRVGKGAR